MLLLQLDCLTSTPSFSLINDFNLNNLNTVPSAIEFFMSAISLIV